MTIIVKRTFAKRDFAGKPFGEVALRVKDGAFEMQTPESGKFIKLSQSAIEYLLTFSLQSLQDAYAGEKEYEGAKAAFDAKAAKIIDGTIGIRTGAASVSLWQREARKVMLALVRKNAEAFAEYNALDGAAAKHAFIDARIETNKALIQSTVDERVAATKIEVDASAIKL